MKPARPPQGDKGSPWFRELYKAFAPVREEALQYSDQEINSAIDEAVVAVRKRR